MPGRPDADDLLVPVSVETIGQAQAASDGADQQAEAATAAAANSNIAASLTRQLDGLRPLAVDIAAGDLERSSVVARLEDGREVQVDLADIRRALGGTTTEPPKLDDPTLEAAE